MEGCHAVALRDKVRAGAPQQLVVRPSGVAQCVGANTVHAGILTAYGYVSVAHPDLHVAHEGNVTVNIYQNLESESSGFRET